MAKQRKERPKTRHLVRWNEEKDQQLLLWIQYGCNVKNIKLPLDFIGHLMGVTITEGAIVQHLSKLRTRLAQSGVRVPPPLKRGGGPSSGSASKAGANIRNKAKGEQSKEDTEDDDDDIEDDEDSEDYGEDEVLVEPEGKASIGKNALVSGAKGKANKTKQELVAEDTLKTIPKSKRRHVSSEDDVDCGSADENPTPRPRRRRKVAMKVAMNNEQFKAEQKRKSALTDRVVPAKKSVARGAKFLMQASGDESEASKQPVPHQIARLPIGSDDRTKAFLERLGYDVGKGGETAQDIENLSSGASSGASYDTSPSIGQGYGLVSQANHMQSGYQNAYGEPYNSAQQWYDLAATAEDAQLGPASAFSGSNEYHGVSLGTHRLQHTGYSHNIGGQMAVPFGSQASYGGYAGPSMMASVDVQYPGYGLGTQSSLGGVLGSTASANRSNDMPQVSGLPGYSDVSFPQSFERGPRTYDQVQRFVSATHSPGTQYGSPSGHTTAAHATPQAPLLSNDFGGYGMRPEAYDAGIFGEAGDAYGSHDTFNDVTMDYSVAANGDADDGDVDNGDTDHDGADIVDWEGLLNEELAED